MSSHEIFIQCSLCKKVESISTTSIDTEEFDFQDWEGEFIEVATCKDCKPAPKPQQGDK